MEADLSHPNYYNLTLGYCDPSRRVSLDVVQGGEGEVSQWREPLTAAMSSKLLKQWFNTHGAEKMRKLYQEQILKGFPAKVALYQHSPLHHLFNALISS